MLSLKRREAFLDRADLIRRLNAVGEQQKASLMLRDINGAADDLQRRSAVTELAKQAHTHHAHVARVSALASDFVRALAASRKAKPVLKRNRKKGPPRYAPAA